MVEVEFSVCGVGVLILMVARNLEIKMPCDGHFARIDIVDIKIEIGKKLGSQKADKYFDLLDRFFSLKLSKSEFDKLCIAFIGRENIGLHNLFIRSILKNACLSKEPPAKGNKLERPVIDKVANGCQRSCIQSLCRDVFPPSPRRGRTTGFRDRKSKDRPSPLGPHGKPNAVAYKDLGQKTLEQQSATELLSLGGTPPIEVSSVEDGEEVNQAAISPGIHSRSPVTPPLGIPWNGKGNRKALSALSSSTIRVETCRGKCELPDTGSLRKRLENRVEKESLRISLDCVNLLNNGLDAFLKRLIKPSLELAGSRPHGSSRPILASMLDFRTAIELNPQILGEDWPTQLEKVCIRECESWVRDCI